MPKLPSYLQQDKRGDFTAAHMNIFAPLRPFLSHPSDALDGDMKDD